MSLILDAINRADQERNENNHNPSLQTSQSPEPKNSRPYLRWAIEALIAIIVLGLIINQWFFGQANTQATIHDPTPASGQLTEPASNQHLTAITYPEKPINIETQLDPAKHYIKGKALEVIPPSPALAADKKSITIPASPKTQGTISALYKQPKATPKTNITEKPTQKVAITVDQPSPKKSQPAPTPAPNTAPLLTDLPWSMQQKIPSLDFTQHNYSQFLGESTVELNRQLLKPGERVAPGLMLVSIDSKFITLNFQGTKFRLWALNSWVNFN